jgi:hypothetical protein
MSLVHFQHETSYALMIFDEPVLQGSAENGWSWFAQKKQPGPFLCADFGFNTLSSPFMVNFYEGA